MSERFLTTEPGTQMEFRAKVRKRPCWRCLTYRRKRRHFGCARPPALTYWPGPGETTEYSSQNDD